MGLDMYAFSVKPEAVIDDFSFNREATEDAVTEIAYWRKHRHLHNYMEKLYRDKGGKAVSFNCTPIRLSKDDLTELEDLILDNQLDTYDAPGFFFGVSPCYENEDDKARDVDFIREAWRAIQDGKAVYYDSWW